jgi:PIN domain nuclease of toxin-antitoxin system
VRYLLDTVAFLYAIESPDKLGRNAAEALDVPGNLFQLSTVSLAEIAIKAAKGKLNLSLEIVREAIADLDLRLLPYAADHAFGLFELPRHHDDPFDRQLIAQAITEDIPIVSPDRQFGLYKGLKVIW